jgi:N-acetyl-alpha-D-glucosaminyl L-malate synthase BshA
MHASNFRPVKRTDDVIRVFARVQELIPARLVLMGDGPELRKTQQLVSDLSLSDKVHFLGEQDQLEPLLACADLFLLPSEQESFGLTALEAMNCGVPVIATDIGGLPELVIHEETGYLFPIGETDRMAEAAAALLSNQEQHSRFGRNARDRAIEGFNANRIIPQYEAFYEEVLRG